MNTDMLFTHHRATPRLQALHLALAALWLAAAAPTAQAQTASTQLTPPAGRITDEAIQADHRGYESLQARIKALNEKGRPVRDYAMAKAQCWLDVSFHEYTRNDRSDFPQAALSESEKLIRALETGATPGRDTPLVNGAARLRPDLWQRAQALQALPGFRCAQQKAACAEVELVHAGNEENQQGWRHAKPYVQIAEDLLGEAQQLAERCDPPAAPAPVVIAAPVVAPVVVPAPAPAPAAVQTVLLATSVLFNFDKFDAANIRSVSMVQLQDLVRRVQRDKLVVQSVQLDGHADRLNGTGQSDYNQRLSEKRAATVKGVLEQLGITGVPISTSAAGDRQPLPGCEQRFSSPEALRECLLPNRRVEVQIEARKP